ncbi:hypothetical protein [Paludibacterium purpuratum]|uniref:Type III secretion system (T3SS) protein YscO n=1 Tax=Paludibacterium purpuratum TaxID=1144873 RepID=A0A4R7B3K2_9NEIS|nr:hypothetical protein [Paludibacterium purpuratum]TDR76600.1 hypothetical protein DFP86_11025 [Paludibacterium purpuratum]
MLSTLVAIKARRASRLRAKLARLALEAAELMARRDEVQRQRAALRLQRQALLHESGVLSQRDLAALRTRLDRQRQSERALLGELRSLAEARCELDVMRDALSEQLRRLLRTQEKLSMMMELL